MIENYSITKNKNMSETKPKEMIFDFVNTMFLLALIAFCVFYFIVGNNWGVAEKIVKIAVNLSIFSILFLAKLKIIRHKTKYKEKDESFDDIAVYFSHADKIKNLIIIFVILFLIFLISFFWSPDMNIAFVQIIWIFFILYFWHFYLFRKRDALKLRMYATILDETIDSVLIYFIPVIILSVSLLFNYYSALDIVNALVAMGILYLRHKLLFVLNEKK